MLFKQTVVYLKACVTSIFGVFHATGGPYVFYFFVASKKNISKNNIPPRFLGHHRVSLKYLKYPRIVNGPPIALIDVLNLHFRFGCAHYLHVLPSLHLKLNWEVLRHWLASLGNISTGWIVSRLGPGSNLRRYRCLHYMVIQSFAPFNSFCWLVCFLVVLKRGFWRAG